jgi:rod shape-determining protein MreC
MQGFIEFILRFKNYISFVALVVISLSLISMGGVNKIGGFRTLVIGAMGWFQDAFSWIPNPAAIKNENVALRELNLQLSSEVTRMRDAVVENRNLRAMLGYSQKPEYPIETVEIVGTTSIQMRTYLMINKGKNHGLRSGMAVRTDAGLVGVTIGVSNSYSLVESIINRDIRVSGKCLRSGYKGIIAWEGGEYLIMKNVPSSYDIKIGDIIVTSEYSNKYPQNIPIGTVIKSKAQPGNLFLNVVIRPLVNFSTIEQAFIVKLMPNDEKEKLIQELDRKLMIRNSEAKREDKIIFKSEKKQNKKKQ